MSTQDRTASEIIDSLGHDVPTKPATELLDIDRMRAEGERQARAQQQDDARRNSDGSPIKLR